MYSICHGWRDGWIGIDRDGWMDRWMDRIG